MQAAHYDQPESSSSSPPSSGPTPPSSPLPSPPLSPTLRQRHPLSTPLPPPAPSHSVWQCCSCKQVYRFSAVRNRCLLCSHRFCKQCPDEHDRDGWNIYIKFWTSITPSLRKPPGFSEEDGWGSEAVFWDHLQDTVARGDIDEEASSTSSEAPESPTEEMGESGWTSDWLFERDDVADIGMQVKLAPMAPYTLQRRYSHPYTEQYPRPATPLQVLMEKENRSPSLGTDITGVDEDVLDDVASGAIIAAFEDFS
ncbi:hypothetical protein HOY80DRAFT_2018 [Tuber brumale]|nr:hypothetical protein HOY80DRAFT_2018 [Tuber brumale]